MANENNRYLSEDQAQHLPPRPDTGGTAGIENSFKQNSRCYYLRDIL